MKIALKTFAAILAGWLVLSVAVAASAQRGEHQVSKIEGLLSTDAVHAGATVHAAVHVVLQKGYHVNSNQPLDSYLIPTVLSFELPDGFAAAQIAYPEALLLKTGGSDQPLAVFEEEFDIGVVLSLPEDLPVGAHAVKGSLRYQACDDKACYAPRSIDVSLNLQVVPADRPLRPKNTEVFESITFSISGEEGVSEGEAEGEVIVPVPDKTIADESGALALLDRFTILGATGGYMKADAFIAFVDAAESGTVVKGLFEGRGPLAILVLILVGGLALNLTPCVLPMVPINLAIIGAGAQAGSRLRGFALGGTYGLAMAFVYGVLGLVVILTASTFGAINASPWFNLAIALLFIVLALAMFDVIMIDFSRFQSKLNLGKKGKGTFLLAFGMGSVAALLAGACVAPVVIQVIVFSSDLYAGGTTLALALPFFLGLGMALPWPFAGGGLSLMPKPGAWMNRVKYVFGVFIFAFAAYYAYLSYELFNDRWVDGQDVSASVEEMLDDGWVPSLVQGLTIAQAEDKPVLVDLWATWCKNCLTMDKTTFKDPEVLARLENYVKVKFQAQDPEASPAKEIMEHFQAIGLPTYAILEPKADT